MLREGYDETYNLVSGYGDCECPIEEDITNNSLYEYWLRKFGKLNIYQRYGIDFDSYLDRPRFLIQKLNSEAEKLSKSEEEYLKEQENKRR